MSGYKPVSWSPNELIDSESLNQINANVDYLNDNLPTFFHSGTFSRGTGLLIQSGRVKIAQNAKTHGVTIDVTFPKAFLPGTLPVVVCQVTSPNWPHAFATKRRHANATDFNCSVYMARAGGDGLGKLTGNIHMEWIAMGLANIS